MKSSIRILAVGLALALLLVAPSTFMDSARAAEGDTVSLDQNEVEWVQDEDSTLEREYFSPGPDDDAEDNVTRGTTEAVFFLRDDDLKTTVTASTTITVGGSGYSEGEQVTFNIAPSSSARTVVDDAAINTYRTDNNDFTTATSTISALLQAENDAPYHSQFQYKYGPSGDPWVDWDEVNAGNRYTGVSDDGSTYNSAGALRPLISIDSASIKDGGAGLGVFIAVTDEAGGEFTVLGLSQDIDAVDEIVVEFTYDIVDAYSASAPDPSDDTKDYSSGYRRARVTSSSDGTGEWVEISEVVGVGDAGANATSNYFMGSVTLSDNADDSGSGDSEYGASNGTSRVWVQDGDTLTVTIYSDNGDTSSSVIATASASIDDMDPEISGITPADGTILNKSNEVISVGFTLADSGSGFDTTDRDSNIVSFEVKNYRLSSEKFDSSEAACNVDSGFTYPLVTRSSINVVYAPNASPNTWDGQCMVNSTDVDSHEQNQNNNGLPFMVEIKATDRAGNEATQSVELRLDSDPPEIEANGVEAGMGWDSSGQKKASQTDSILVKFKESLNPDTVNADDFDVVGFQVISAEVVGVNADDEPIDLDNQNRNEYVALTLSPDLAPNSRPDVGLAGSVEDEAGNIQSSTTKTKATNKIKPSVTVTSFTALLAKGEEQEISFSANEDLRSATGGDCTCVSVSGGGSGIDSDEDAISISLPSTRMAQGTFEQKDISPTGIYGVMVQALDRDNNTTNKGSVEVTDEDVGDIPVGNVGSPLTVSLDNWPIADHDLDGDLKDGFTFKVNGASADATVNAINWEAGEATVQLTATYSAGGNVTVSYYYVDASQVIQVDVAAPSVTFVPGSGGSTDDVAPFIQINFDEDEYAGDTHKTVSVDSATLTAPDGSTTNIADNLTTTDNIDYLYRPSEDLALGEYQITVSATDEAGNQLKDASSKFTVKARAKTKIDMLAGWNLVSLRGAPVSLEINDVITDPSIDVVSTYDPALASPWTVWTRGTGGTLESSPAGRTTLNPGHGLWVRSSTGQALEVDIPGLSRNDVSQPPPVIPLSVGWNLVAAASVDPDVKTLDPDVYFSGLKWVRVYEYDTRSGRLIGALPDPEGNDTSNDTFMDIGKGYWVYLSEAGVLIP